MAEPIKHSLAVRWFPETGKLEFDLPQCAVMAAGLLGILDAAVKVRVIGPTVVSTVVLAPGPLPPKLAPD